LRALDLGSMINALSKLDPERKLNKVDSFILDALDAISAMETGSHAYTQQQLQYFLGMRAARAVGGAPRVRDMQPNQQQQGAPADVSGSGGEHPMTSDVPLPATELLTTDAALMEGLLHFDSASPLDAPAGSFRVEQIELANAAADANGHHQDWGQATPPGSANGKRRRSRTPVRHMLGEGGSLTVERPVAVHIDLPDISVDLGLHSNLLSAHVYGSESVSGSMDDEVIRGGNQGGDGDDRWHHKGLVGLSR
jgi:hypothetical protein